MGLQTNTYTSSAYSDELLLEIEEQGTPLRIEGKVGDKAETYFVLSASQLIWLMQNAPSEVEDLENSTTFTAEDFGLTEEDIVAQEARHRILEQQLPPNMQKTISADLEARLSAMNQQIRNNPEYQVDENERERLIQELEDAMLENTKAAIPSTA